jgi:hypothetical protein
VELFCLILLDYSVWKMYQTNFFHFFRNEFFKLLWNIEYMDLYYWNYMGKLNNITLGKKQYRTKTTKIVVTWVFRSTSLIQYTDSIATLLLTPRSFSVHRQVHRSYSQLKETVSTRVSHSNWARVPNKRSTIWAGDQQRLIILAGFNIFTIITFPSNNIRACFAPR